MKFFIYENLILTTKPDNFYVSHHSVRMYTPIELWWYTVSR